MPTEVPNAIGSYETGGFRIDVVQRVLLAADGNRVPLPSRAFDLLLEFVRHPGELLDKNRLMAAVWPNTVVEENNLTQSIGALRKALGEAPGDHRFLVTEPGRGYRFVAAVRAGGGDAAPVKPARRVPAFVLVLVLVAILAAGAAYWWLRPAPPAAERSIAVMPFENHSPARENEYLALGIQDELLILLTRISDLRVVPRTSTLRFARTEATAAQIGRQLGVSYLLQGSVQREGNGVRVHVVLIDAAAERHVWAQTYERPATDVFAIESEVAQAVALALQAKLSADERRRLTHPPTASPDAYDAYLRARASAERTTRTEAEIQAAIHWFEVAVRADPQFASAWAQLSRRHANFFSLAYDRTDARRRAARSALDEATRLAPDTLETQAARGYYLFVAEGNLGAAEQEYRALEARAPQSPDAAAGLAQILQELGQRDRSLDYSRRVLALDALNPYRHSIICQDRASARELELALRTCERALALLPGDAGIIAMLAGVLQARGEIDRSGKLLRELIAAPGDWRSLRVLSRQHLLDRQPREAVALLAKSLNDPGALGVRRGAVRRWLADAQRLAGDAEASRASYALALEEIEAEIARQPDNPVIVAELAILRARTQSLEAGVRLERRCLETAENPRRVSFVEECRFARVLVELAGGDPARVVALLKQSLDTRGTFPPMTDALLRLDPEFDPLRSRPDFQGLMSGNAPGVAN
jgi:TolB-like protein/DNA-binding winged helix-turn-helix (wHTH) protein